MKGRTVTIHPTGSTHVQEWDGPIDLAYLQAEVGGYIEAVPYFTTFLGEKAVAFCNEEGKLEGLPTNPIAQAAWELACGHPIRDDLLVGPIVVVTGDRAFMDEL